jgi:hypothetical protein
MWLVNIEFNNGRPEMETVLVKNFESQIVVDYCGNLIRIGREEIGVINYLQEV